MKLVTKLTLPGEIPTRRDMGAIPRCESRSQDLLRLSKGKRAPGKRTALAVCNTYCAPDHRRPGTVKGDGRCSYS